MIIKFFTQLILATAFVPFFPSDVGELQRQTLSVEQGVFEPSFDFLEVYQAMSFHLPESSNRQQAPINVEPTSLGVVTSAQSAIVIDRASHEVLFEKNIHQPRSIGSITKLMTAFVFLKTQPDVSSHVVMTSDDVRLGAAVHIPVGETVTVRNLLEASLVGSDNSSTAALARLSGFTEGDFVAKMNEMAVEFGMQQTTFADTTGLSPKNVSVVTDLVLLFDHALENPLIAEITQKSSIAIAGSSGRVYTVQSTDELLGTFIDQPPYDILGAKTGFLPEAGYCLGTVFSHENEGQIVIVVLGSETKEGRFQDAKSLAVWTYETFDWPTSSTRSL